MLLIEEVTKFIITGLISLAIDYGILYLLIEYMGLHYLLAAGWSFAISAIVNYILCVTWVFTASKKFNAKSAIIFFASSVVGLFLNELFMYLLVDFLSIHYLWAKFVATVLVMIWNYVMKKKAVVG